MPRKELCPFCKQVLPAGITEHDIHEQVAQQRTADKEAWQRAADKEFDIERSRIEANAKESANKRVPELVQAELKIALAGEQRKRQQADIAKEQEFTNLLRENNNLKEQAKTAAKHRQKELDNAEQRGADSVRQTRNVELEKIKKDFEAYRRKVENKPAWQLGKEGECSVYDQLNQAQAREWTTDTITPQVPGQPDSDFTHIVRDANYRNPGKIVYEIKNRGKFDGDYIRQVLRYRARQKADLAIIVSRILPIKKWQAVCDKHQIVVLGRGPLVNVVSALRKVALMMAEYRLIKDDTDPKAQRALALLHGDDFKRRLTELIQAINGANGLIRMQEAEETWHKNRWAERRVLNELIEGWLRRFQAELNAIMDGHSTVNGSGERKLPGRESAGGNGRLFTAN